MNTPPSRGHARAAQVRGRGVVSAAVVVRRGRVVVDEGVVIGVGLVFVIVLGDVLVVRLVVDKVERRLRAPRAAHAKAFRGDRGPGDAGIVAIIAVGEHDTLVRALGLMMAGGAGIRRGMAIISSLSITLGLGHFGRCGGQQI